jgi:hypothetical protein
VVDLGAHLGMSTCVIEIGEGIGPRVGGQFMAVEERDGALREITRLPDVVYRVHGAPPETP